MKRLLTGLLLGICFVTRLPAADAPAPVAETVIRDVPRLIERLKTGPFGQIWRHQDLDFARGMVMGMLEGMSGERLPLMEELVADLRSIIIRGDDRSDPAGGDLGGTTIALHLPTRTDQAVEFLLGDIAKGSIKVPVQRLGEWVVLGKAPTDASLLVMPAAGHDDQDIHAANDLTAVLRNPETPPEAVAVLRALGLRTIAHRIRFDAQGTSEEADMPGLQLPLMAVDPAAVAVLPDGQVMVGALGLDGARLDALLSRLSQDIPALAENLARMDRQAQATGRPAFTAVVRGCKGTLWFATAPGAPFPTFTIGCPAGPEIDALLTAAASEAQVDLAAARTEAQVLPLPAGVPLLVQIRRTADQWVLSSDQRVMDALAANAPGGFRPPPLETTTVGFFVQDTAGLVRMAMGYLPLLERLVASMTDDGGAKRGNQANPLMAMITKGLGAALPHLHPSRILVQQDAQGVSMRSRNALMGVMPTSFVAGMILPAIGVSRSMAQRSVSGKNMQQIYAAMIAWQTSEEKWPPPSYEQLAKEMALPKKLFQSPGNPAHPAPYLFVTCIADPPADQPVLIEDPACHKNQGTMVCFGDAHVKWIKAPGALRLWQEAKRLAASPKAAMGGIELTDWAAVNDVLGLGPAAKPAVGGQAIP